LVAYLTLLIVIFGADGLQVEVQETYWKEGGGETYEETTYVKPEQYIMQFTGLKDKNSKEMYEGDICTATANLSKNNSLGYNIDAVKISWERGGFFMEGYSNDLEWQCKNFDIEIIGNIHQNPELINR